MVVKSASSPVKHFCFIFLAIQLQHSVAVSTCKSLATSTEHANPPIDVPFFIEMKSQLTTSVAKRQSCLCVDLNIHYLLVFTVELSQSNYFFSEQLHTNIWIE